MFVNPLNPSPQGNVFGNNAFISPYKQPSDMIPRSKLPENTLPRYLNYIPDYTGCGHWRMLWPEHVMNSYRHCVMQSSTVMVSDPKYFIDVNCIRVQRQATPGQEKYLHFLKEHTNARIIYEIDDVCIGKDIPNYNAFKDAFVSDETIGAIKRMMEFCDEMTVVSEQMKQYFLKETNQKNITVIPNYPPRFWIGNLYDTKKISQRYDKTRKKPRILYAGSSTHFDIHQKNNHLDDFSHVMQSIINNIDKFTWVFVGGLPTQLKKYVDSGQIEFHKWSHLLDYPYYIDSLNINAAIIPLADNIFNRCKSDIKYLECSALGIPATCQDIGVYSQCKHLFTTGDQMIDNIIKILSTKKEYMNICDKNYKNTTAKWLENEPNRRKYCELYEYEYGSPDRVNINKLNDI